MLHKILMACCLAAWSVSPLLADAPAEKPTDAAKAPRPTVVAEASTTRDGPETARASVVAEGPTTAVVAKLPETRVVVGSSPMGGGGVNECLYTIKRNSKPKKGCRVCPRKGDVVSSERECEDLRDCPRKYKAKRIDCPDPEAPEKAFCKKINGKRDSCGLEGCDKGTPRQECGNNATFTCSDECELQCGQQTIKGFKVDASGRCCPIPPCDGLKTVTVTGKDACGVPQSEDAFISGCPNKTEDGGEITNTCWAKGLNITVTVTCCKVPGEGKKTPAPAVHTAQCD